MSGSRVHGHPDPLHFWTPTQKFLAAPLNVMQHAVILAIFALEMFNAVLAISPQLEDSELEANDGVSRWRGVTLQGGN